MSVIGTPISSTDQCDDLRTTGAEVTKLYGVDLPTKRRALAVNAGVAAVLRFQLFNQNGDPVDLSYCPTDHGTVVAKMREVISTRRTDIVTVDGTVADADDGIVTLSIPTSIANEPGVYNCELGAYAAPDDSLVFTNQFYLWVNRGLFGDPTYPNAGPPSIDEIRLFLRDNAPEENRLLDDFEFDLAEMCHAAEMGVRYWNESQPPIGISFNTRNYAVRDRWMRYIAGHMLQVAAHRFRRNHLPYQAGGISIDDQNKFIQYDQAGAALVREYQDWVKLKKVEINCSLAITSSGSAYGSQAYVMLNSGI